MWKQSGKTAWTWCRENQVIYTTFMGWCRRLEIQTEKANQQPQESNQFIELQDHIAIRSEISLEYAGMIIHLKGEFDLNLLTKCLVLLRGISC